MGPVHDKIIIFTFFFQNSVAFNSNKMNANMVKEQDREPRRFLPPQPPPSKRGAGAYLRRCSRRTRTASAAPCPEPAVGSWCARPDPGKHCTSEQLQTFRLGCSKQSTNEISAHRLFWQIMTRRNHSFHLWLSFSTPNDWSFSWVSDVSDVLCWVVKFQVMNNFYLVETLCHWKHRFIP